MARVIDLNDVIDDPVAGDAAWLVAGPRDCGLPGCNALHEDEEVLLVIPNSEQRGGRRDYPRVLSILCGGQMAGPFGLVVPVAYRVTLHGNELDEFFADVDEARRVLGR